MALLRIIPALRLLALEVLSASRQNSEGRSKAAKTIKIRTFAAFVGLCKAAAQTKKIIDDFKFRKNRVATGRRGTVCSDEGMPIFEACREALVFEQDEGENNRAEGDVFCRLKEGNFERAKNLLSQRSLVRDEMGPALEEHNNPAERRPRRASQVREA